MVTAITSGGAHTCARLSDATMKCWGSNDGGQLGDGTLASQRTTPVAVVGVTSTAEVAAGDEVTCASLTSGEIRCWGANWHGVVGDGTSGLEAFPIRIQEDSLNRVMDVAGGEHHTCVLWDAGSVKCWGRNSYGQLGDGSGSQVANVPVDVSGISTATAIGIGWDHSCALLSDSTIKCWGRNDSGQLGNGTTTNASTPVAVTGISTATALGIGAYHSCARLSDSTIKCWGNNGSGQLGDGTTTHSPLPRPVTGITSATTIAAGNHTCATLNDATVKCWGNNVFGQLGNGTTTGSSTPVTVSGLTNAVQLGLGLDHSCAVVGTGAVKCWGHNGEGALGNGSTADSNVPVDVYAISTATNVTGGINHSCARLSDRTVRCWGTNGIGQLGNGSMTPTLIPVTAVGVTAASSVSRGGTHTCARQVDATLKCWGSNDWSKLGNGFWGSNPTPQALRCGTVEIERSDYFVNLTTAAMPDSQFNGLAAQLDMHRVKPVMFPETCSATKGIVMVHGRTVEAVSAFDLQYQDYSFMEQLARTGVDTFTFNHLGMGKSKIPTADAFANSCNASLPSCLDTGYTCPPPQGILCDCGPAATFGVNDKDQQGSTRYLNPNPRTSLCAHTTNTVFTSVNTMVNDLDVALTDALSKANLSKVSLLGYSAGGVVVGNYLGVADDTLRAARTAKVDKAIFVSSLFGLPQIGDSEPSGGSNVHSYSMGVMDRTSATAGGFNIRPECPGQRDPSILDPIWASVRARDTVASAWGPTQTPPANGGLSRFPHATRWGWNGAAAARVTVPVLVMQGLADNVVPVATSANLYAALTGTGSKTIVQIGCGSHSIFWEGCSGAQCNSWTGPHATIFKNTRDWIRTGMIYASPGSTNGSFASNANDGANYHTGDPTSTGPAASEENQLP
jgi:alpha-tubulin suppressor-like RCC1 family protein/alpha-beta hydrolase superfamily lysophospholipase